MKYDHFSMLPERAFQPRNGRTGMTLEGGGGGGGHTTSTVTQSSIPDWLRPQTEALLGAGTQEYFNTQFNPETGGYDIVGTKPYTPYSADPRDYVAEFSPQQQQVFGEAAQMETPGGYGQGSALTGGAAMMALNPMSVQPFMSPYMQDVVNIQKMQAIEDAQKAQLGANLGAARSGTYGGARQTLLQGQREAGLQKTLSDIQAQGLQSAYDKARQAQQFGITTGLQAGSQLANIAGQQQQADLARLGFQGQMGDIQQQQQQRIIDQAIQDYALSQEMPMQRLAGFNALLRGYATPTSTVSQYSAAPSGLQQLSGLGMTAAGLGTVAGMGRKAGGVIKYAEGGITDVNALEGMAEDLSIPQLQQSMQNETLPKYVGMPILENKVNEAERMKMAQSMMGGQQQGGQSISDALMAKADQLQGITAVAEPVMAAGGGMVAFADGGLSIADVMRQATLAEQREYQRTGVLPARLQGMLKGETTSSPESDKYKMQQSAASDTGAGIDMQPMGGIAPTRAPVPKPNPQSQGIVAPPPPAEQKKDMAALLAEREAQQKAFLGEDPSIKRLREALEKQGEESFLDRLMRGSQMVFAGEAQRTRGDIEPAQKVLAGEAARKQAELKRQEALAEVESADYRRKADIYKEVAGEERKKAETKEERAFQEKLMRLRADLTPQEFNSRLLDIAMGKKGTKKEQEFAKNLLETRAGSRATDNQLGNLRAKAISNAQKSLMYDARYLRAKTLEEKAKVKEIIEQEEMDKLMPQGTSYDFSKFSSRELGS